MPILYAINTSRIGYQANKSKGYLHVTNMAKTKNQELGVRIVYYRRMIIGSSNVCKMQR